jgi:hypothetical protein
VTRSITHVEQDPEARGLPLARDLGVPVVLGDVTEDGVLDASCISPGTPAGRPHRRRGVPSRCLARPGPRHRGPRRGLAELLGRQPLAPGTDPTSPRPSNAG